jgi:hypothetical protein
MKEDDAKRVNASLDLLILVASSGTSSASDMASNHPFALHISYMLRQDSGWPKSTKESALLLLGCLEGLNAGVEELGYNSGLVCPSAMAQGSSDLVMAGEYYPSASTSLFMISLAR